ncbi:WD40 repeat-like protein [Flagelloscypha sp. PMI_526]|nr:WD40 repeat-like protein [Flagelloscypha sp. PMI_526]
MNAQLLNPFQISHPTAVQTSLLSNALFARFDSSGRYLAAGRYDGSVAIWDVELKAVVRWLDGHVKAVTSIDWSRNSKYIMTASKDWNIIIWDLTEEYDPPQRKHTIRFDVEVHGASFHPRNSQIVLALMGSGEVYMVDMRKSKNTRVELVEPPDEGGEDDSTRGMTAAKFDPTGKLIFVGTTGSTILVFNSRTQRMVARHRVPGAGKFRGFEFGKSGRLLVSNSSDKVLRQFILPSYETPAEDTTTWTESELEATHKFVEPINKFAWNAMSYSPDGEWLAGGASDPSGHKIYVWDMANDGYLASPLEGGREPLTYLHWHPSKAYMASTTKKGNILLWHTPTPEKWGAFAGGFEELDENIEYEEKEDEFDIEDEADIAARKKKEEDREVDIETMPDIGDKRFRPVHRIGEEDQDKDFQWADEDPDDDISGWRMHTVILDDDAI